MTKNKKLNLKKTNALIKRKNTLFKKATKPQKRVMIAKDVLAQIEVQKYKPQRGKWVDYTFSEQYYEECRNMPGNLWIKESVQKLFAENKITDCAVCALGGLFMSCTNLNNNTTIENLGFECYQIGEFIEKNTTLSNSLNRIFSKSQLSIIESYFECNRGRFKHYKDSLIVKFNIKYSDPKDRMVAIMNNIIKNKGTFIPKKLFSKKELQKLNNE